MYSCIFVCHKGAMCAIGHFPHLDFALCPPVKFLTHGVLSLFSTLCKHEFGFAFPISPLLISVIVIDTANLCDEHISSLSSSIVKGVSHAELYS